jgi:hypothetical protein
MKFFHLIPAHHAGHVSPLVEVRFTKNLNFCHFSHFFAFSIETLFCSETIILVIVVSICNARSLKASVGQYVSFNKYVFSNRSSIGTIKS